LTSKFYEMIAMEDEDRWGVSITDSENKFFGVSAMYGSVSAKELGDGTAQLSFHYDVIDNPWDVDVSGNDLHNVLGEALEDILYTSLESGEYRMGDKVESGTADN